MIELDQLIDFYRGRIERRPQKTPVNWGKVYTDTITYLVAFKQVYEMLKRLADAVQGTNPEGD